MKDKSQLQAGWESAERGKAVGAKTQRERAYLAAAGKLYSDYEIYASCKLARTTGRVGW